MKRKLYSTTAIQKWIRTMILDYGYEMVQVEEGTLGFGHTLLYDPSEESYHYVIKEVPLNEWSSAHTVRRTRTLSKRYLSALAGDC